MTAPFHHVGFADFWLADQLNSLTTVLLDFEYLICFYALEVDWLSPDGKLNRVRSGQVGSGQVDRLSPDGKLGVVRLSGDVKKTHSRMTKTCWETLVTCL